MKDSKPNNKKINRILVIIGILLTLLLIPTFISFIFSGPDMFSSLSRYLKNIVYGFSIGILFWFGNWTIGSLTGHKLNWLKKPNQSNLITLLSFIFYGILISIAFPYVVHKFIFEQTGENLRFSVTYNAFLALSIDLIIISVYYSRYLVHYWKKSIQNYEEAKREHLVAKYEALKNQVNPHFLFNSLNTLTGIVEKDPEKSVYFIKRLADIYRYVLEQRDKELVTLREEIDFVKNYIYLAKMRHGNGLNVKIEVKSFNKLMLPLGLQMLVENCIKHNIISDDKPLTIRINEENREIAVTNNFQPKKAIKEKEPQGLENLRSRIFYLTGKSIEVIHNSEWYTVRLPVIESD